MYNNITSNHSPYKEVKVWISNGVWNTAHPHKDSEAYNFLSSNLYIYSMKIGEFTNVVMPIVSDIMTQYIVYKRFMTEQPNKYNNYYVNYESLNTKLKIHEDIHGRSGDLPIKSVPNSSKDLYVDNKLWQRRYYDSNGKCIKDIDYYHTGTDSHSFPHNHYWIWENEKPIRK